LEKIKKAPLNMNNMPEENILYTYISSNKLSTAVRKKIKKVCKECCPAKNSEYHFLCLEYSFLSYHISKYPLDSRYLHQIFIRCHIEEKGGKDNH